MELTGQAGGCNSKAIVIFQPSIWKIGCKEIDRVYTITQAQAGVNRCSHPSTSLGSNLLILSDTPMPYLAE